MKTSIRLAGLVAASMVAVAGLMGCKGEPPPPASAFSANPNATLAAAAPADASSTPSAPSASAASLKVTVSLSPAIAGKAAPTDLLFIFARPSSGRHMPVAVVKKLVKDLPVTVVLDDTTTMSSRSVKLSSAPEVIVVARVSKSGDAMAKAGDLEGSSGPIKNTGAVTVSIDKVLAGK